MVKQISLLALILLLLSWPLISKSQTYPRDLPTVAPVDFQKPPSFPGLSQIPFKKEWYVSPAGKDQNKGTKESPLKTLERALELSGSGDRITLRGGVYGEGPADEYRAVMITKENLQITAFPGEKVTLRPKNENYRYGVVVAADGILLQGLTVEGFDQVGIQLGESGTLRNTRIVNVRVTAPQAGYAHEGIINYHDNPDQSPSLDGLLLENVQIENTGMGFSCNAGPCLNVRVNNLTVKSQKGNGDGNSGMDAIAFENGQNLIFYQVTVESAPADAIDLKADRVVIYNSRFSAERNGIKLWRGGDIVNTIVAHTGADASIVFDGPGKYRMLNSLVAYHLEGQAGAYTMTVGYDHQDGNYQVEMTNNIFYQNSGPLFFPGKKGLNFKNNLFTGFAENLVLDLGGEQISESDIERLMNTGTLGSGNLPATTVPGFTDPKNQNWELLPSSPLLNKGKISSPYPSFDLSGKSRVQEGAPDLGPFERP